MTEIEQSRERLDRVMDLIPRTRRGTQRRRRLIVAAAHLRRQISDQMTADLLGRLDGDQGAGAGPRPCA